MRQTADVCGDQLIEGLADQGGQIVYVPAISDPGPDDGGWEGETGFVHELVDRRLTGDPTEFDYYAAGPPPMVEATLAIVRTRSFVKRKYSFLPSTDQRGDETARSKSLVGNAGSPPITGISAIWLGS